MEQVGAVSQEALELMLSSLFYLVHGRKSWAFSSSLRQET